MGTYDFESISGEIYALNVLYERARKKMNALGMIPDGILDRDLDSCIKIRIEFPFSRLSINCVKRNGNNHPGQRSFRGQIKVIYESSRNILPTDV